MRDRVVSLFSNQTDRSLETKQLLESKLRTAGFEVVHSFEQEAELVVCVGGDGAFLQALHQCAFPGIPFLGINTGHL